jgi:predicted Rossmann-fold nucleotide-binding protein
MSKRELPFQPVRSRLYTSSELSAGFDPTKPESMVELADFLTYRYFKLNGRATPVDEFVGMMEALHDNSILQAMFAFLTDRPRIAAIMGGHREDRGSTNYRRVAHLAKKLSKRGFLLASGGGPGAMEATHLGALLQNSDDSTLDGAIDVLAAEAELPPNAQNVVDSSGRVDMEIVKALHKWSAPAHALIKQVRSPGESLAVPTWHYGHEPVTPLASHVAKYFLNSIREDVLLYLASQGIVFAPGRAGTLQEVFQDAAQNYYPDEGKFFNPMVFFDADGFWTNKLPVKPLLEALFKLGGPEREGQFRHRPIHGRYRQDNHIPGRKGSDHQTNQHESRSTRHESDARGCHALA